jgi:hypothetical protein
MTNPQLNSLLWAKSKEVFLLEGEGVAPFFKPLGFSSSLRHEEFGAPNRHLPETPARKSEFAKYRTTKKLNCQGIRLRDKEGERRSR